MFICSKKTYIYEPFEISLLYKDCKFNFYIRFISIDTYNLVHIRFDQNKKKI